MQTTAAVHAGRTGGDVGDAHESESQGREPSQLSTVVGRGGSHGECQLTMHAFSFHPFEPGVEVLEDVAGFGVEDAADEDVGHWADVVRVLADELADAELAAVPGFGQFADPGRAAGEVRAPICRVVPPRCRSSVRPSMMRRRRVGRS